MVRKRSALAVIAAIALAASVSAPAGADTGVFKDKKGDIKGGLDIHSVRVDNDGPRVGVRSTHRNLKYGPKVRGGSAAAFIDIAAKRKGPEFIIAGPVGSDGDYHISKVRRWKMVGDPLACKGLRFHVNYKRDVVTFSAPRRCLDRAYDHKVGKIRAAVRASQNRAHGQPKNDWWPKRRHLSQAVAAN
ncbi:hypothetical protein [Solicola gregarius]|uniref:Uncharacterized protein n=1 Tax=Solicola gregarius TaxID=2908642 RepID=A0AA46TEW0_9ACTN|nr:hypothetical protein [Solicola gregarius]UYM03801.1 hypothetical protein L0C25_14760 [Solicola gregarius]